MSFTFEFQVSSIAVKLARTLGRIASFISFEKRRTRMKAFIETRFNYCPLMWIFNSRKINNKINSIHEKAWRLVYSDPVSFFGKLLKKDRSFSIHHRHIQSLTFEMYNFFTVFLQVSWIIFSNLTQIFHTTFDHTVNFIVEIQEKENMEQRRYLT